MDAVGGLLLIVAAYLAGAVPWGVVLGRTLKGIDIRQVGSGGTGATNSLRALGGKIAISVLVLDFLKGLIPVLVARALDMPNWVVALVAIAPVVGHCWSPFINFRGGKGMATGGGIAIGLSPWFLLLVVPMVLIVWRTRFVSLGSMISTLLAVVLALGMSLFGDFPGWWTIALAVVAVIIVFQHRANIARLRAGTENRFGQKLNLSR